MSKAEKYADRRDLSGRADAARHTRRDVVVLVLCVAGAFALRAWALNLRGVLDYDEAYYYILGRNLLSGNGYTLNGLPHTAFPPLYPLLTGIVSLLTPSIRAATSAVSAFAGALLVIPVYFLAGDVYGRVAGRIAAAAAAVWPSLFFYGARSVTYRERLYAGSEPLFLLLVTTALLFLRLAARRGRIGHAALSGLFFGLAALTRNEGITILMFAGAWFAADALWSSRPAFKKRSSQAAVLLACFAITISPWLVHVRRVSGAWSFGSKLTNLARTRPALREWILQGNSYSYAYVRIHNALSEDGRHMKDDYWGVTPWHRERIAERSTVMVALGLVRHPDLRWLMVFFRTFVTGYLPLVPHYAWPFVTVGLIATVRARRLRWLAFTAAVFAALAFTAVVIYCLARFQLPLVVFLLIFFAHGLACAAGFLARRFSSKAAGAAAVLAICAVMAVEGIYANLRAARFVPVENAFSSNPSDAAASRVLARRLPPGSTLMSNEPWIALHAGLSWRTAPVDTPARIARYAAAQGIDYAILGDWQVGTAPENAPLQKHLVEEIATPRRTLYLYCFQDADAPRVE